MKATPIRINTDKELDWGQVKGLHDAHGFEWFLTKHDDPAYEPLRVRYSGLRADSALLRVDGRITRPDGRIFKFEVQFVLTLEKGVNNEKGS